MGSGGASSEDQIDSADILRSKGLKELVLTELLKLWAALFLPA